MGWAELLRWRRAAWWPWWCLSRYKKPLAPKTGLPPSSLSQPLYCRCSKQVLSVTMSSRNNFRLWSNLPPRHETMTSALEEVPLDDIRFQHNDLWISTQFDLALASKLPLILSAVLQTTTPGEELARKLTTWFTNFPVHLLEDLYQTTVWGRGTVILPNLTEEKGM